MKKNILIIGMAIILAFGTVKESRAECTYYGDDCLTLKESGTCGTGGCIYTYDAENSTIYVTTKGDIIGKVFSAYAYDNNVFPAKNIVIDGKLNTSFGTFYGSGATVSGKNGVLVLGDVGHHVFDGATLAGNIIIPDGTKFDSLGFLNVAFAENAKVYCAVENCAQKIKDSCEEYRPVDGDTSAFYADWCLSSVSTWLEDENVFEQAPENCALFSVSGCTKCKNENFKLNDGECDRLRWTPAEAAKVLRDDNTNEVTITFKK